MFQIIRTKEIKRLNHLIDVQDNLINTLTNHLKSQEAQLGSYAKYVAGIERTVKLYNESLVKYRREMKELEDSLQLNSKVRVN